MECYEKYYEIFIETNEEKGIKINNWKKNTILWKIKTRLEEDIIYNFNTFKI